ncbi:hypothetical protein [Virgibacillus ndiopensis]|uniref:hypothetical protein n=1 Tax=Virgibacillus ndiopensis TaxID=2004408 RepID=UPI000C08BAE0|nr:hypothetical protein [Virgibacillus ndiopensis]
MSTNSNFPNQLVDMLVDSTLKKHGVNLDEVTIDSTQKEQIRNLVESLKNNVESLNQQNKENKENKTKKNN